MEDEREMPKLSYVYTDLTINTLRVLRLKPHEQLHQWLEIMKKRGVTVMTYIKTSKYASYRYCLLEDIEARSPSEVWGTQSRRLWDVLVSMRRNFV